VEAARDGRANSFCTHGDSPSAVEMATAVREAVVAAGITIAPFVDPP
jgi:5-oxoprolinase (ATP-hydrolysing) subunit A